MRRLDQLLASLGYCSRREARDWVAAGAVTVHGEVADDFSVKANPADVRIDGEPPDHPDGLLLLLHKPLGLVCSHELREGPNVYSLLPARWQRRTYWVSRLLHGCAGVHVLVRQSVYRAVLPELGDRCIEHL